MPLQMDSNLELGYAPSELNAPKDKITTPISSLTTLASAGIPIPTDMICYTQFWLP